MDASDPEVLPWLLRATAALKRRALAAERRRIGGRGEECETLEVGEHRAMWPHNRKQVCCLRDSRSVCPALVNRSNWATDIVSRQGAHMSFRLPLLPYVCCV